MKIQIQVDFDAFWYSLKNDIDSSKDHIYIQTYSFEGDQIGKMLSDLLMASTAGDKRILADSFTKFVVSDKFLYSPANLFDAGLRHELQETRRMIDGISNAGIQVKFTNPIRMSIIKSLGRNHKKLIVIDNKISYIGGINFSEHNSKWHDMMIRIEDSNVAEFLRKDFLASWNGQNLCESKCFEDIEFHTLDGRSNNVVLENIISLIDGAQDSIIVVSPYISFPFYKSLYNARRRDVSVELITPAINNWRIFNKYTKWAAKRSDIVLRLYTKNMSHLKAMLIDERILIAGSSNFDLLSYTIQQEIIAVITAPEVITNFRDKIINADQVYLKTYGSKVSEEIKTTKTQRA